MTASQRPWRHPEFARGARDMTGISLGIGAWGLVTGIAMVKTGMGVPLCVAMSLLVFAGSAQLASLPLITQGAPLWVIWAAALCVNLRFVILSAGWRPYFAPLSLRHRMWVTYFMADLNYVAFMKRFPRPAAMGDQLAFVWGGVAVNWTAWQVMSLLGIALAIAGLTLITIVTRAFFLIPEREVPIPAWLREALRYAPLAALVAVLVPEIAMTDDHLIDTWKDARLYATAMGVLVFCTTRNLLGTILAGSAVLLALRIGLGW